MNRHVYLFLIVAIALASCNERPKIATSPTSVSPSVAPAQPATPVQSAAPAQPATSVQSAAPAQPATSVQSAAPVQPAATSYQASLREGISFAKPGYPEFVAAAEGISQTETFGRWTDGPKAAIVFRDPLPKKFELIVKGAAYGPNIDQPVKVTVGGVTQEIVFNSDLNKDPQTRRLSVSTEQPADRIEFLIPQPTQPANGDLRKLGIALIELKIEPAAK